MAVGIDILEIERVKNLVNLNKVFTKNEIDYFNKFTNKDEHICGFFCAKEAIFKCLNLNKLNYLEIEICHFQNGKPYVEFYGETKLYFNANYNKIDISISHTKTIATAIAISSEKSEFKPITL